MGQAIDTCKRCGDQAPTSDEDLCAPCNVVLGRCYHEPDERGLCEHCGEVVRERVPAGSVT